MASRRGWWRLGTRFVGKSPAWSVKRLTAALVGMFPVACGSPPGPAAPSHPAGPTPGHGHDHAHNHGRHANAKGAGEHHEHSFADAEGYAKHFDSPERAAWQKPEEVVGMMAITPGMHVADLGAGTGYFLPHLSRAVGKDGLGDWCLTPMPSRSWPHPYSQAGACSVRS